MTRKDFILLAEIILRMPVDSDTRALVAAEFGEGLVQTNSQFKRELFIQAATGECPLNARRVR